MSLPASSAAAARLPTPRARKKEARRVQLLRAALAILGEKGLEATTIALVAEKAAMSRGIINFYFKSKDSMLREALALLLEEELRLCQKSVAKAPQNGRAACEALFAAVCSPALCQRKRLVIRSAFLAYAATHAPYRYQFEQARLALAALLEVTLQKAEVPLTAQEPLLAAIEGMWLHAALGLPTLSAEQLLSGLTVATRKPPKKTPTKAPAFTAPSPTPPAVAKRKPALKLALPEEEPPVVADLFATLP